MNERDAVALLCCALIQGAAGAALAQEPEPEAPSRTPLPTVPETVWPPPYTPLEVFVTPQKDDRAPVAPGDVPDWARIMFEDAAFGSVLDVLHRHFEPRDDWRPSGIYADALRLLRPPPPPRDTDTVLTDPPDLGTILGGRFFALDLARIYVSYGLREDGSRPEPAGFGIYSPLSPIYCLGPGNSCMNPILSAEDPRAPKGDAP